VTSAFQDRCTAVVRDLLHERWFVSGFGRAEPSPPVLRVERLAGTGALHVSVQPSEQLSWLFPWGGSEAQLAVWLETVTEDYWGDYIDREYPNRQAPQ
jgi:hypothetical protein